MTFSRWLQKTNVAETTMANEFNLSPQLKQTLGKCFRVVVALVMAVAMFVMPIQTVNATQIFRFTDSGQELGNSRSYDVSLGDVDKDGDLDALVPGYFPSESKRKVELWLNDGNGNFTNSGQVLNEIYQKVILKDVNKDGNLDAFLVQGAHEVWFGDGEGNFTDSGQALGDSRSVDGDLGDVDGDGDLDAFVVNYNWGAGPSTSELWLNDGNGNFTDGSNNLDNSELFSGSLPRITLADLDKDDDLDAVAVNGGSQTSFLNQGNGTFIRAYGGVRATNVSFADVDGDGYPEPLLIHGGNEPVSVIVDMDPLRWDSSSGRYYVQYGLSRSLG